MTLSVGVKLCSAECEGLPRLRGGGRIWHITPTKSQPNRSSRCAVIEVNGYQVRRLRPAHIAGLTRAPSFYVINGDLHWFSVGSCIYLEDYLILKQWPQAGVKKVTDMVDIIGDH